MMVSNGALMSAEHRPAFVDMKIAEKQAAWLEKVLAEEHERDKEHPDRIELPD
jgi:hypothetical protein